MASGQGSGAPPIPAHRPARNTGPAQPTPACSIPPTEISYSSYPPSPAETVLCYGKHDGIKVWKRSVPRITSASRVTCGSSVGECTATWRSEDEKTLEREAVPTIAVDDCGVERQAPPGPISKGSEPVPRRPPKSLLRPPLPSLTRAASHSRSPPIPVLAQPPSPATPYPCSHSTSLRYPLKLSMAAPIEAQGRSTSESVYSDREAYLASVLELPLDLLAQVDKSAALPVCGTSSKLTIRRLGSLLEKSRSARASSGSIAVKSRDEPDRGGTIRGGKTSQRDGSVLNGNRTARGPIEPREANVRGIEQVHPSTGPKWRNHAVGLPL